MTGLLVLFLVVWNPDQAGYRWVQDHLRSATLDPWVQGLTETAGQKGLTVITLGYDAYALAHGQPRSAIVFTGVGLLNAGTVTLLKGLVNRPRPAGTTSRWNSSFPSGHSSAAFYVATYLGGRWPRYRWPLYLWASGVAFSRVYLERHWPSDVVVGALLGLAFGHWALALSP